MSGMKTLFFTLSIVLGFLSQQGLSLTCGSCCGCVTSSTACASYGQPRWPAVNSGVSFETCASNEDTCMTLDFTDANSGQAVQIRKCTVSETCKALQQLESKTINYFTLGPIQATIGKVGCCQHEACNSATLTKAISLPLLLSLIPVVFKVVL